MPAQLDKENVKMADCADCNVFQFCQFLKLLGKVMIILVLLIVGLTYWAVVTAATAPNASVSSKIWNGMIILLFTVLVVMLLWSYFAAVTTDPGRVPVGWHPFATEEEAATEQERLNYASYRSGDKSLQPRFCKKCQAWKPIRAHHDSMTGSCVLKMDHYCIWVLNCVGLLNYKAFLLFLFYTFWATLLATATLLNGFVQYLQQAEQEPESTARPAMLFLAFVLDAAFALAIIGFLIMHCRMIARNLTTIEMYEKRRNATGHWPYDKGVKQNYLEVFGTSRLRWFVPSYTKEETRELLQSSLSGRPPEVSSIFDSQLTSSRDFSSHV